MHTDTAAHDGERLAFATRFNLACDRGGIPPKGRGRQRAVGRLFGVSQEAARKWLEGECFPDTKRVPAMARRLGVKAEWLLAGDDPHPAPYTPYILRLAEAIQRLPPRHRAYLEAVARLAETLEGN
jgi:transcriptional regulator with XRE-family HTH domain